MVFVLCFLIMLHVHQYYKLFLTFHVACVSEKFHYITQASFPSVACTCLPINVCDAIISGTADFLAVVCLLCLILEEYLSYLMRHGSVLGQHNNLRILSHFPNNLHIMLLDACQYTLYFLIQDIKQLIS